MKLIIIIGGGISSLYLSYLLLKTKKYKIYIYEKNNSFGGRIKTEYSKDGNVLYETGPWRFHSSHIFLKKLLDEFQLDYCPIKIPISYKGFKKNISYPDNYTIKPTTELTEYQYLTIEKDMNKTNIEEMKTGYNGIYNRANTTNTYSIPNNDPSHFFIVKEGFSKLVEILVQKLQEDKNCILSTNTMVTDIFWKGDNKKYEIIYKERDKEKWVEKKRDKIHYLILGIPPSNIKQLKTFRLTENISMVKSLPLCHIMGKVSDTIKEYGDFKYICNSPISQVISSLYSNRWIQISYSAGRMAELFQNLSIHSLSSMKNYIKNEFYKFFPKNIEIKEIRKYFWRNAVHYWLPNIKTTEEDFMIRSIFPHPKKYPNLFWIGESISKKQGWIEGALETSLYCYKLVEDKVNIKKDTKLMVKKKEYVFYNGRKINISKWKYQHPGGIETIENHIGEDITDLWNSYHSPEMSRFFIMLEER